MKKIFLPVFFLAAFSLTPHARAATTLNLSTLPTINGTDEVNNAGRFGELTAPLVLADFNGDGKKDIIMGAVGSLEDSTEGNGVIYIKYGSATPFTTLNLTSSEMDFSIINTETNTALASGLVATDINGDGVDDVIALGQDLTNGVDDLYVYYGSASRSGTIDRNSYDINLTTDASYGYESYVTLHLLGAINGAANGNYLAMCSNSNYKCLLISVPNLVSGSGTIQQRADFYTQCTDATNSVASGDIDGDGNDDLVLADPVSSTYDNVTIFFGPLSSSSSSSTATSRLPSTYFVAGTARGSDMIIGDSDTSTSEFGNYVSVTKVFDSNSVYNDVVIGKYTDSNGSLTHAGSYQIISGASIKTLRDSVTTGMIVMNDYSTTSWESYTTYNYSNLDVWVARGDSTSGRIGSHGNAAAGYDVNGDGQGDVILGGNQYSGTETRGVSYLKFGGDLNSKFGIDETLDTSNTDLYALGETTTSQLSSSITVGDINGDGLNDTVIAANGYNDVGRIYVNFGAATDNDGDGVLSFADGATLDCNDAVATTYPGALELPDALDNNCDGRLDENLVFVELSGVPSAVRPGDAVAVNYIVRNDSGIANFRVELLMNNAPLPGRHAVSSDETTPPSYNSARLFCTDATCTTIASTTLSDVGSEASGSLNATIPTDLPSGEYRIRARVVNADNGQVLNRSLTTVAVE